MGSLSASHRVVWIVFSGTVVGLVFGIAVPRIAAYGSVWGQVRHLSSPWAVGIVAATLLNILTFAPPWMAALPGLRLGSALALTQASTAVTLLVPGGAPVGMAASYAMLRSWGLAGRPVTLAVALTGIWNQLSTFVFPVVALPALAAEGIGSHRLEVLAAVGLGVFVGCVAALWAALASERLARRVGDVFEQVLRLLRRAMRARDRPGFSGESLVRLRADAIGLLRRRWLLLTVTTLANQLTGWLLLELCVRAVGLHRGEVSLAEVFGAWSLGRLLASLPLTPGGIGIVELGLTGTLVAFGGRQAAVVAAVLLYRFLSVVPVVVLGGAAALTWNLHHPGRTMPDE